MTDDANRVTKWPKRWIIALSVASLQILIAVFAVYSSTRDVLSDGACIGGIFGTLGNFAVLAVAVVWLIALTVRSFRQTVSHPERVPLIVVVVSSAIAIVIGLNAAMHCTV